MEIKKRDYDEWLRFCENVQNQSAFKVGESKEVQHARIKACKKDYNLFFKTYLSMYCDEGKTDCAPFHIEAAHKIVLEKRNPESPDLLAALEWPREHAKSVHADIGIPMFMLAHEKLSGMILMGKNEDDACNLLADVQAQLQFNQLFAHDYGDQYNMGSWSDGEFTTRDGIRFLAIGRKQSPRGARKGEKRPNYFVGDDVDDDELVHNQKLVKKILGIIMGAVYFGLDTKRGGTLIMAGNRIHSQSVLAHFVGDIKPGAPKRKGLYHSKIYAIDPKTNLPSWPRYTYSQIMSKVEKAGPVLGRREFFHENTIEGDIFKESYFHFKKLPKLSKYTVIIGYFDPSFENKPTSDFKAVRVWGGYVNPAGDWEKHCIKSFVRQCELHEVFDFMSKFEDKLPIGVGVIWYVEKQFFNRPIQDALTAHNKKRIKEGKRTLSIIVDTRKKEEKYTRIVKMQPAYANHEVFYNMDDMHQVDMVTGNNQLKGIEPGYKSPDDSPDADEGAWYYLDAHVPDRYFEPVIGSDDRNDNGW